MVVVDFTMDPAPFAPLQAQRYPLGHALIPVAACAGPATAGSTPKSAPAPAAATQRLIILRTVPPPASVPPRHLASRNIPPEATIPFRTATELLRPTPEDGRWDLAQFEAGQTVVRRDVFRGGVWSAQALRVVRDTSEVLVVACPPAAEGLASADWELARRTSQSAVLLLWKAPGLYFSVYAFHDLAGDHRLDAGTSTSSARCGGRRSGSTPSTCWSTS
ncbi:hypothetical protein SBRY_50486 [Actinacidiphila bryophytorum]|uniref:Uncharacterized protein n=1 Tax=Actinacidiphila bryophytorum TaxID=1436133 RepID=A0A9W4MIH0_9ACTN|nr:hypothetical protein SBRY_50486 [Actinacidiphila bryophytorum]